MNLLSRSTIKLMDDIGMLGLVLEVVRMVILLFGKMSFIRNFLSWNVCVLKTGSWLRGGRMGLWDFGRVDSMRNDLGRGEGMKGKERGTGR